MKRRQMPGSRPRPMTSDGRPVVAAMTRATKLLGVILHHARKRGDAGREAETFEAVPNCLPGSFHHRRRIRPRCRDSLLHGVAFLLWIRHPEPIGSRRATPLLLFQQLAGHPRGGWTKQ